MGKKSFKRLCLVGFIIGLNIGTILFLPRKDAVDLACSLFSLIMCIGIITSLKTKDV